MNTFNPPLGGVFAGFLSYGKEYKMKKTLMALTSVATLLCANGAANAAGTIQGTLGVTLTIGAGCTIGHRAMLHGCTIGDNSLIGMGAIVLNGARIGKNCLVGAGALVTEGKEFPDNSLIVGSPARVVRSLDDGAVAGLRGSAAHYVANGKRFKDGLKQL